jgi:Subtilase family
MTFFGFRAARPSAALARPASTLARVIVVAGALLAAGLPGTMAQAGARVLPVAPAAAAMPSLRPACPPAPPGYERCFALYRPQAMVNAAIADGISGPPSSPVGLSPKSIESAYRLPVSRDSDQTVAVSIAFHTPHLAHYLAVYRQHYHLPPCTVASGCFREVNQHGKAAPLPPSGLFTGWDLEVTLDVSMISVACPDCRILVVEANDPGVGNLAATDNAAARLGAQVISNSYGQRENGFALADRKAYDHPGHMIVASSGDIGFTAANFPADLQSVTAVGGTRLSRARGARGWAERTWHDSQVGAGGSGCSAYVAKPAWQHDRHCPGRTIADVSAVAANIPIFNKAYGGWVTVAGTSVSAPLIAGIYGLAGNGATVASSRLYSHARSLFDVTKGNNGLLIPAALACGNDYLCAAKKGYDAPTGMGTPDGTGAF